LHASNLSFKGVEDNNEVSFSSPLPEDILNLEENLENLT
jgi:hypothetical protein